MTDLPVLEKWIDGMAPVLKLEIKPEYRPGVLANLKVAATMASLFEEVELEDEAEHAAVYTV